MDEPQIPLDVSEIAGMLCGFLLGVLLASYQSDNSGIDLFTDMMTMGALGGVVAFVIERYQKGA